MDKSRPSRPLHPTFFDADVTDAGKFHPEVDANGNCGAAEKVSLLSFLFAFNTVRRDAANLDFFPVIPL